MVYAKIEIGDYMKFIIIRHGETFANALFNTDDRILIGALDAPVSQLNENGWVFAVAALRGLIAKEDVIAAFGALAGCIGGTLIGGMEEGVEEVAVMIAATGIDVPALISFIAFNMLTIPCFAAVAAARGEIGKEKFKWTLLFWIVVSYLTSSIVYTVGRFVWPVAVWAVVAALAAVGIILYNKHANKKEAEKRMLNTRR